MAATPRVDAERLTGFAAAVYSSAGMPEADARLVADTLVQADLWGHQSHGVLRLGWYLDRVRIVIPSPLGKQRSRDPKDDPYLAAALAAEAKCVVTYDDDLLVLGKPFGIEMVKPGEFLRRLPG